MWLGVESIWHGKMYHKEHTMWKWTYKKRSRLAYATLTDFKTRKSLTWSTTWCAIRPLFCRILKSSAPVAWAIFFATGYSETHTLAFITTNQPYLHDQMREIWPNCCIISPKVPGGWRQPEDYIKPNTPGSVTACFRLFNIPGSRQGPRRGCRWASCRGTWGSRAVGIMRVVNDASLYTEHELGGIEFIDMQGSV